MSYSNYVLNQRLSNIEYELQHGTSTANLENVLTNGNDANNLSIKNLDNIEVTTINGSVPAGGDVFLAGGTSIAPQTFTGFNQFDEQVVFSGIGSNTTALQITQSSIPTTGSVINMLANNTSGAYNQIVHLGDSSIYSTSGNGSGTGALCLTTWNANVSGVRVVPTGVQLGGVISGGVRNDNSFLPINFQSAQTTGNNPIADFSSIILTNSKVSVIADPTAGEYSYQTTAGDLVMTATATTSTPVLFYTNTDTTSNGEDLFVDTYPTGLVLNESTYSWNGYTGVITAITARNPNWLLTTSNPTIFTYDAYTLYLYNPVITNNGGVMELCSKDGASIRITPSSINMISSSTHNNFELLASIPGTPPQNRGLILSWNNSAGFGETDFLNCAEGGSGGFYFYNGATSVAPSIIAKILPSIDPSSSDTTLATTAFVQSALSNIPSPTNYTLNIPASTGITGFQLYLTPSSSLTLSSSVILTGRISYTIPAGTTTPQTMASVDFIASVLVNGYILGNTGSVIYNFNTTTAEFPNGFSGSPSISVDADNYITILFPLISTLNTGSYLTIVCLSSLVLTNYTGLSYNTAFSHT